MPQSYRVLLLLLAALGSPFALVAQVNPAYEVATWRGFKAAAVTYTLDDNTAKQLPVALPLFDQYGFKTTLFTVTGWGPDWAGLRVAAANGHEIASHTVSHPNLATLPAAQQLTELQQSQAAIRANVPTARCETVAYPFCSLGNLVAVQAYYLAGRACDGRIMASSPADFYRLSAISTGTASTLQTATGFNATVESAKAAGGWCVFLTHGIDADGGYSPTSSAELAAHLAYMNTHRADYWVGTFAEVVKYIRERNAVALTETVLSADSVRVVVSDGLPDALYDVPVTIRRMLPPTWPSARAWVGRTEIPASIATVGGRRYLEFEVVPDRGAVQLAKSAVLTGTQRANPAIVATTWPNPFLETTTTQVRGRFAFAVYSLTGQLVEAGRGTNRLSYGGGLLPGTYVVKISQGGQLVSFPVTKR